MKLAVFTALLCQLCTLTLRGNFSHQVFKLVLRFQVSKFV